jgi:hypothetical protein
LPVTIGTPANGLAVTEAQVLTIDKAQIFAGTSSQFVKGDGTLDSTAYGTGSVTSVALTMPSAFSVAGSPITTDGTLAVTGAGTTAQYIRGDGTLATFPALTGFVPYTGATADVNLGTHDLAAERGTFENNGSSNTLTVNHTSGSGYGIIVTKGGNNEALYVSKTSGSGNAMTVVGGRTSLVDLALSSVSNTAGDFLTLSGGVVHKRTAAQTLTDIGGQAALTNPVTGTGTTNYLAKFTGSTTLGNSQVFDNGTNVGIGIATPGAKLEIKQTANEVPFIIDSSADVNPAYTLYQVAGSGGWEHGMAGVSDSYKYFFSYGSFGASNSKFTITSSGNVGIGTTSPSQKLEVNNGASSSYVLVVGQSRSLYLGQDSVGAAIYSDGSAPMYFATNATERMRITSSGNVSIGSTSDTGYRLYVSGNTYFRSGGNTSASFGLVIQDSDANNLFLIRNDGFISAGATTNGRLGVRGFTNDSSGYAFEAANSSGNTLFIVRNDGVSTFTGNVGIGTFSPSEKLHVANNGTGAYSAALWTNSNSTANLYVGVGGSGVANTGLQNNAYVLNAAVSALVLGTSDTERMRITSGGELLVLGTYNPFPASGRGNITLNGSSSNILAFTNNSSVRGYIFHDNTDLEILNAIGMTRFYTANTERMRITSTGNVGIGTISPASKLHIEAPTASYGQFRILNTTSGGGEASIHLGRTDQAIDNRWTIGQGTAGIGNDFGFYSAGNRLVITTGGNVGIGTNSPAVLLHLNTTDTVNNIFRISNGTQQLNLGVNNSGGGSFIFESAAQALRFGTSDTERARITSSGNVLIGTTTDSGARLQVSGRINAAGGGSNGVLVSSNSSSVTIPTTGLSLSTGFNVGYIQNFNGGNYVDLYYGASRHIFDGGNVGIGTSTEDGKLAINTNNTGAYNPNSYNGANANIRLTNGSSGSGRYTGIAFTGSGSTEGFFGVVQNSSTLAEFVWQTYNGAAYGERMRMTSSGNVLIGTTTDVGAKLYVNGGIRTANPTGSTSNDWLLGRALTSGTSSPDRWIRVQIGNLYYDILAVYMGSV